MHIILYTPYVYTDDMDMVCLSLDNMYGLSQGVIQTSTVLGGTVSYFVMSSRVNSTVLGRKLLRGAVSRGVGLLPSCPKGV